MLDVGDWAMALPLGRWVGKSLDGQQTCTAPSRVGRLNARTLAPVATGSGWPRARPPRGWPHRQADRGRSPLRSTSAIEPNTRSPTGASRSAPAQPPAGRHRPRHVGGRISVATTLRVHGSGDRFRRVERFARCWTRLAEGVEIHPRPRRWSGSSGASNRCGRWRDRPRY
jgi:hypothetical protein